MRIALSDLRYSWLALLRRPLFAATAVLTLAVAIGGNLVIGSMLYARFAAPLPYPDAERLVVLAAALPKIGIDESGVPAYDFMRWKAIDAVEAATVYNEFEPVLSRPEGAVRVEAASVMHDAFAMLGMVPALGTAFAPDDEDGVMLSHRVWQQEYAGDPTVLGRTLRIDGQPRVVRGVLEAGFVLPDAEKADYFVPLRFAAADLAQRNWATPAALLRLKPGASIALAQTQVDAVERAHLAASSTDREFFEMTGLAPRILDLRDTLHGDLRPALMLLQWAVLGVLLLACANVAHLQLLRASQRRSELGLRQALGAGRGRLARLVFSEVLLLAVTGAALGGVLAVVGVRVLSMLPGFEGESAVDPGVVLLGALALCGASALLCALPAVFAVWRAGTQSLRPGQRVTGSAQSMPRLRQVLVVLQTALTVVLLIGAGLLLRSFGEIVSLDPGFHRAGVLTARLDIDEDRFANAAAWQAQRDRIVAAIAEVPGVTRATLTDTLPFGDSYSLTNYALEGEEPAPGAARPVAIRRNAMPDYFAALGIPLLHGRLLGAEDASQRNVVVDARFAQRHFPGGNAIGQRLVGGNGTGEREYETIVGVVGNVAQLSLERAEDNPSIYRLYESIDKPEAFLVVRSELPLSGLVTPIREALLRVDPDEPARDILPLQARIDDSLEDRRSPLMLLGVFAAVALALAAIGQYGLMAWNVAQRENELGLRMAIGARRGDILWLVLRGGVVLTGAGLGIGVLLAAVSGQALRAQLYGVGTLDPLTYVAVAALLAGIGFVACLLPALRATRVAPAVALRGE